MVGSRRLYLVAFLAIVLAIPIAGCGGSRTEDLRVGVLAACEGTWGYWHEASLAAAELPFLERGAHRAGPGARDGVRDALIAGRPVRLIFGCSDGHSEGALSEARRLVESERVDILIGPTTLSEAVAVRDYAARTPQTTFVSGSAAGQAITLDNPPDNLFRFAPAGTQWMAGLGSYAYHDLGWRRVVTLGDEWSFSYLLAAGFAAEFCALGGKIVKSVWLPPSGNPAVAAASVPKHGVDGFVAAGFPDLRVLSRIAQLRGSLTKKLVGSTVMLAEPEVVHALGKRLDGVVYADPTPGAVASSTFTSGMTRYFPEIGAHVKRTVPPNFYTAANAVVRALEESDGDLSDSQAAFRAALSRLQIVGAGGPVRLDARHQAVTTNYLVELRADHSGNVTPRLLRRVPDVEQTFGGYFGPNGESLGRDTIKCQKREPPRWAAASRSLSDTPAKRRRSATALQNEVVR